MHPTLTVIGKAGTFHVSLYQQAHWYPSSSCHFLGRHQQAEKTEEKSSAPGDPANPKIPEHPDPRPPATPRSRPFSKEAEEGAARWDNVFSGMSVGLSAQSRVVVWAVCSPVSPELHHKFFAKYNLPSLSSPVTDDFYTHSTVQGGFCGVVVNNQGEGTVEQSK